MLNFSFVGETSVFTFVHILRTIVFLVTESVGILFNIKICNSLIVVLSSPKTISKRRSVSINLIRISLVFKSC
jgi:hypothetical protein